MSKLEALHGRIETRDARIGVIGLGYVGLPLLIEFSRAGFPVLGLDVDEKKVRDLKAGRTYIRHIPAGTIAGVFTITGRAPAADATTDFGCIGECDAILICVPTP
ncbi:MAG TPA: NAD(P)-binding domain-containing protein, partial [Myxococcota bacterium]|nr:NAD(P)-binding domain-containing protein [Myxococcota bacterium]